MSTFDPFATETSEDGYTGTITSVTYAPGKYGFQATITTRHDIPRTKADGTLSLERPEFLSIGANDAWRATESGTAFESTGTAGAPRANSGYGRVMNRIKELCPEATSLVGLHVEWASEGGGIPYSFDDKDTGEHKEGKSKAYMMPVAVSMDGASPAAVAFDVDGLGLDPMALAELTVLAQESTPSVFRAKALPLVVGNNAAVAGLGTDAFYQALKG